MNDRIGFYVGPFVKFKDILYSMNLSKLPHGLKRMWVPDCEYDVIGLDQSKSYGSIWHASDEKTICEYHEINTEMDCEEFESEFSKFLNKLRDAYNYVDVTWGVVLYNE